MENLFTGVRQRLMDGDYTRDKDATGSMTAAGMASLITGEDILLREGILKPGSLRARKIERAKFAG